MAKRSTRRMRGGFIGKILELFTGKKETTPTPIASNNSTQKGPNVVVVNPQGIAEQTEPGASAPTNLRGPTGPSAFGGARRRRRSTKRKVRTARKNRKAHRKSRRASRKH